jgi:ferredoxin
MQADEPHFHYVSTRREAEALIAAAEKFWVSNCGCREGGDGCGRSRMDVCLFFDPEMGGTGSGFRAVDRDFVAGIMAEAEDKRLVYRPFRYDKDRTRTQGVCFCCDDCCYYLKSEEAMQGCDRGRFVAGPACETCSSCGACVDVCYFGAREMEEGALAYAGEKCFGCGLCADFCPERAVAMEERP